MMVRYTHHDRAKGFILLEIIIGIAVSSMIGVALMNTFFQSNTMVQMLDDIFMRDRRTTILNHVVEKDISGIFIPMHIPVKAKKQKVEPPKPMSGTDAKAGAEKKKEEPTKKLEKVFYAVHTGDGTLKTLSFITTSVLGSYNSAKPRIARVVYRLEEIKGEKDPKKTAYTLMRQEGENLDFDAFKPDLPKAIRSFELVDNVKNISCEYGIVTKKDKKAELKFSKEWVGDDKNKDGAKDKKDDKALFPNVIILHVVLWDAKKQRDFTTDIAIPILADHTLTTSDKGQLQKEKKEGDDKEKKDGAQKTGAAPVPGGAQQPRTGAPPAGFAGRSFLPLRNAPGSVTPTTPGGR